MTMTEDTPTATKDGRVVAIAGPVIDVEFPRGALPELNSAVEFDVDLEGETIKVLAEVAQQLGNSRVRADLHEADRRPGAWHPGSRPRPRHPGARG